MQAGFFKLLHRQVLALGLGLGWLALLIQPVQAREFIVQLKWHHQFQFAGYYAALHKGFYEQAGLDVILKPIEPGLDLVAEVTSGRADFAISNSGLLESWAQGEPIVALAAIMQHSPGAFIGVAGRKISNPSDLIGARVMVPKAQQGGELVTLLHHLGLQDRIQRVKPSYDIRDLIEGRVDLFNGYLSNEPFILIEQGLEPLIINPRDYGVDFYSDVLFTREALVEDAPEEVEAFREATIRGWRYALEHKDELVQLILAQYAKNASPAKLTYEANTLETLMLSDVVDIGHMSRVRWEKIRDQLASLGLIPKNLSLDGFLYEPQKSISWSALLPWAIGLGTLFLLALIVLTWVARSNIRLSREVSERRRAEERAFYLATHDPLTDLPNRSLLGDRLKKLLNRARREELTPALLFMDLDNFKLINDTYGHETGDKVLQEVAHALRVSLRTSDNAARFAGDEFVVLLDHCASEEDALTLANKLRQAIMQQVARLDLYVPLGVSIGVLWVNGNDLVSTVLQKADKLMYQAKRKGRNFNQFGRTTDTDVIQVTTVENPDA